MTDHFKTAAKYWVALLVGVLGQLLAVGVFDGTAAHWVQIAVAVGTALGVYLVPNGTPVPEPIVAEDAPPPGHTDYDLDRIILILEGRILNRLDQIMATIQEILDDETTETGDLAQLVSVVQSQQDTIASQAQIIADLQANQGNLSAEQQAQLDAINVAQDANDATIRSLLPAEPPPAEPTP